jgi:hypothetical protein
MTALIRTHRDPVGVFLNGGAHDISDGAVVAEMDDFRAFGLNQAPHDVYGGVVPIE